MGEKLVDLFCMAQNNYTPTCRKQAVVGQRKHDLCRHGAACEGQVNLLLKQVFEITKY